MANLTDKEISRALRNLDYYVTLEPADKLRVLVKDIMRNGDMKKANFENFISLVDAAGDDDPVNQEQKMDIILEILEMHAPTKTLQVLQKTGLMSYMLPYCFPIKHVMDKRDYYAIIDNMDKCADEELAVKLNLLLFPFEVPAVKKTLEESNFEEDAIDTIVNTLDLFIEFINIKSSGKLKNFVHKNGRAFYIYMDEYATLVDSLINAKEYKRMNSRKVFDILIKRGDPFFVSDLKIGRDELKEIGITDEKEADAMLELLLDHCLKKPEDNIRVTLLELAQKNMGGKLKRKVRSMS
jgi:hypothetical protein